MSMTTPISGLIWVNQPIYSFLVGCLNSCLQGTNVRVISPQPWVGRCLAFSSSMTSTNYGSENSTSWAVLSEKLDRKRKVLVLNDRLLSRSLGVFGVSGSSLCAVAISFLVIIPITLHTPENSQPYELSDNICTVRYSLNLVLNSKLWRCI